MASLRLGLALHALFVVHLGRDLGVQATTSSLITTCNATSPQSVGDGSCDSDNNHEDCEYDGGDCCPCTCEDGDYLCGTNGFDCQDPMGSDSCFTSSPTWSPLSTSTGMYDTAYEAYPNCSSVIGYVPYIGDGYCDSQNNKEECGYDGGDCCLCTCVDGSYSCGVNSFACMDPLAPTWCIDATSLYPNCTDAGGYEYDIDDGYCHSNNNIEECGYDGGDCCNCTCVDSQWSCGYDGFDCQDPTVSVECASVTAVSVYLNCTESGGRDVYIGDGYCHSYNNIEECGYDGGDCCACTCDDNESLCGLYGYNCTDPSVSIECASVTLPHPNCTDAGGYEPYVGNGYCNSYNNIEECGYDGGDCCNCTCDDNESLCGLYGYNCTDPSVSIECASVTSPYPNCTDAGGYEPYIGNGYCNSYNNIEECGYDGGDCCDCTCDESEALCGLYGYNCTDPSVSIECASVTSPYPNCTDADGFLYDIGNGYCNLYNNIEECGYDGGDCCACTCDGSQCGTNGYHCQDPTVPADCANETAPYNNCTIAGGSVSNIGDGHCYSLNNIEDCGYDGGDCCPCTCKDGGYYTCGTYGYSCLDPAVSDECSDPTYTTSTDDYSMMYPDCEDVGGSTSAIGTGYCTSGNNNEECGYDGGDCCACTCINGSYTCGLYGYDCQDPTVTDDCSDTTTTSTDNDDSTMYPDCQDVGGYTSLIGNGYCSSANNNEECGYDGGDCCACTCIDASYTCGYTGYDCQDPTVTDDCSDTTTTSTENDDSTMYPDCGGYVWSIGNGYCTSSNNNEECGYDGGDCCACTCINGSYTCGLYGYDCQDPTVPEDCSDTTSTSTDDFTSETYPDCEGVGGDLASIGSGYCTAVNNNEECGYDGGDCCSCTCLSTTHTCGSNGYNCQDPTAPSHGCSQDRSSIPCTGDVSLVGDGLCDTENNNVYCDYDGGDCCSCTCSDADGSSCGDGWYDCHDPDANCGETLGTVGVALITGAVVFVLTLCCYFVTRAGVINRIRGRKVAPESKPKAPHNQRAIGASRNSGAVTTPASAPVVHGGYVVQVGTIEEKKMAVPKPTAPALSQVSGDGVENEGEEEKKAQDPKCSGPKLTPVPEHPDVEDNAEDEEKTSDPKAPAPAPYGDICTVDEGVEERKTLY